MNEAAQIEVYRRKLGKADFERMNLPEDFWRTKVQYVQDSVRKPIVAYLRKIDEMVKLGAGLCLSGPNGVGKTSITALAAKEARSRGYTVYFSTVWELRECIRSRIGFDDNQSVLGRAQEVDLLILDDLRPEDAKQPFFGSKELQDLAVHRRNRRKPTIFTTQLDGFAFADEFPGLSAALEGCMVFLPVKGRNLREDRKDEIERALGLKEA